MRGETADVFGEFTTRFRVSSLFELKAESHKLKALWNAFSLRLSAIMIKQLPFRQQYLQSRLTSAVCPLTSAVCRLPSPKTVLRRRDLHQGLDRDR